MWRQWPLRGGKGEKEELFKKWWKLLHVLTESQLPAHPSSSKADLQLCAPHVHESIDFSPSSPACVDLWPGRSAGQKQNRNTLCVGSQASFKAKDLCLYVPTNNIRIRRVHPDRGVTLPLRAFLSTAPYIYLSNQSINQSIKQEFVSVSLIFFVFLTWLLNFLYLCLDWWTSHRVVVRLYSNARYCVFKVLM